MYQDRLGVKVDIQVMFSELSVSPSCSIQYLFLGNDSTHVPYCRSLYLTSNTQQRYILKTIFWKFKEVKFSSFGVMLRYFLKINFLQCSAKPLATAQSRTNFILRRVTFSKEIVRQKFTFTYEHIYISTIPSRPILSKLEISITWKRLWFQAVGPQR